MKRIKTVAGVGLSMSILLAGCGGSSAQLPALSGMGALNVLSREEGSGTRAQFEELTGTSSDGTKGIAASTEDVLSQVESDTNAIGYLAYYTSGAIDDPNVKVLSVDGVSPDITSIKNNKYPLTRDYLLAYSGSLNEVETDFIEYILSEGQDTVAETCIPVRKTSTFLSDKSSGSISISGSSSAAALVEQLAEEYEKLNPNADITVESTDSTSGLTAAITGECDLAMSSRSLKQYEAELLETQTIATDGIAVIVNAQNPLEDISTDMLKNIYDGRYQNWSDMN